MDTHLSEIVSKERNNVKNIHLYASGEYWAAFEQSAYLLCQAFSKDVISVINHAGYPFPVVMAAITDRELRAFARRHIFKRDEADYKELVVSEIYARQYHAWHRREVMEFMG